VLDIDLVFEVKKHVVINDGSTIEEKGHLRELSEGYRGGCQNLSFNP